MVSAVRRRDSAPCAIDAHAQALNGEEASATVEELGALYRSGLSGAKIAKLFGVSRATIYRWLKTRRVTRRRPGARDLRLNPRDVIALYEQGATLSAVAARFGCHRATVSRLLRAHGVR